MRFTTLLSSSICLTTLLCAAAAASSHREAPAVAGTPRVDGTDFYMFRSYENGRDDYVTFIANYIPLQDPYGGPNYFMLDPDAEYDIHIDNDGDAVEDITFRFRPNNRNRWITLQVGPPGMTQAVRIPLIQAGPISATDNSALNTVESYKLDLILGDKDTGAVTQITKPGSAEKRFSKPVDNIGQKTIADYPAYAATHMHDIALPGGLTGRVFVGQRKDSFVVNLGETFDLINTNPLGPVNGEEDSLADKNITSFILEVPIAFLVEQDAVIGAWTTAARTTPATGTIQHSRLGSPLVNEVVIGLGDKDSFNGSEPINDAQFALYVTHPTLPELIEVLFGVQAPTLFPRADLVQAFLTGIPGLNQPQGVVPAEMLRLNTSVAPVPKGQQQNLGALAGDTAGFPNGRRPGDDVVDIELRVAMGALLSPQDAPAGQLPYTDGAFVDDSFFDDKFPYLRTPLAGSPN